MMGLVSWLDPSTQSLVHDLIAALKEHHAQEIHAIILYGSLARHEERSLDDPYPSDVDLLVILARNEKPQGKMDAIHATMSHAFGRHLDAQREVNVVFAARSMHDWDAMFVANVLRDGIALYGALPRAEQVHGVTPDLAPLVAQIPAVLQHAEQAMQQWLAHSGLMQS